MTDPADERKIRRFGRTCALVVGVWLAVVIPVAQLVRPTYQDFSAFYMGGALALRGDWQDLYPVPAPGSPYYIGWDGTIKPGHQALAGAMHVKQLCPFLQPPWNAWFFAPLALVGYETAHWIWLALSIVGAWGVACLAGRTASLSVGRPTRLGGWVTLLVGFSPLLYRSIRVGNTSVIVALCMGAAALLIYRKDRYATAAVIGIGAILKYATAALVPLMVVTRRWKGLAALVAMGIAIVAVSLATAGTGTFREFLTNVAPSMNGSTTNPGNQSIYGLLLRATHVAPLPGAVRVAVQGVQWGTLLVILWLLFRRPREDWKDPRVVFAGSVAMVAWLLIFGPLFWEHYHVYFCPFWGWMLWEARQSLGRAVTVAAALAMAWLPLPVIHGLHLPEVVNSHLLWSAVLMGGLAMARLGSRGGAAGPDAGRRPADETTGVPARG